MKPGAIEFELTLGVSDDTAEACTVILNHYLRNHPEMEVDIMTVEYVGGTLAREIHLRNTEATA